MEAQIINLPKVEDPRGNLSIIEEFKHICFILARIYWIYSLPAGQLRGEPAFKKQKELIDALFESFDVWDKNST